MISHGGKSTRVPVGEGGLESGFLGKVQESRVVVADRHRCNLSKDVEHRVAVRVHDIVALGLFKI